MSRELCTHDSIDNYGAEVFETIIRQQSWTTSSGKFHEATFNPYTHQNDDIKTFIYIKNLRDWRRIERLYFKTQPSVADCYKRYYDYAAKLFKQTKRLHGKGAKGFYLKHSYESKSLILVEASHHSMADTISIGTASAKEADPEDASISWVWVDTPEQDEFHRLYARAEDSTRRNFIVRACFHKALKFRLQDWCRQKFKDTPRYVDEKRVVSVENEGRSYGFVVGYMGEIEETLWAPHRMMTSFK